MTGRLHGLDYIRLVSFFAIATFHVSLIHYHTPAIAIAEQSRVIKATEQISRLLAFSGFTICFLSSLLTAFSGSSLAKRIRLFAFLLVGWAAFSALMSAPEDTWLVWDIYPLIFTGIMFCSIIQLGSERALRAVGIAGFCMLWIPFWQFRDFLPLKGDLGTTLGFGDCATDVVEWPVFPWIGLVFFGYWVGNEARVRWKQGERDFFRMPRKEGVFWGAILATSMFDVGNFYGIQLGQAFACEAYRQPPMAWWSHFVWPLFFIRLSFDPRVQAFLSDYRISRFVSGLAISRKFWLVYFTNYLFCYVISMLLDWSKVEETEWNIPVIAFIAVFLVPVTEILARALLWSGQQVGKIVRPLISKASLPMGVEASEKGASLLVVMIVVAALGATVGGLTLLLSNKSDARMLRNSISGKHYAADILRQTAASPDVMFASKGNDPLLRACIQGRPGTPPFDCTAAAASTAGPGRAFELSVPYTSGVAPVKVTATNPNRAAAHYNWRGLRTNCAGSDETCMYWATSRWWAECPNKVYPCAQASKIYVVTQLIPFNRPKSGKQRAVKRATQEKVPTDAQIRADIAEIQANRIPKYAVMITPTDIEGTIQQTCPTGATMSGTQANGMISCVCEQGYVQQSIDASTNWPVCTPMQSCPRGEILAGIDEQGQADCYKPPGVTFNCETHSTPSTGVVNCSPGFRMREVSPGSECNMIKSPFEHVECGAMRITCCAPK